MTERAQNADLRRKPQIFADSPLLLEIPAFGGHRKPQKTADFRRKPKIFAENRRKPQIGLRHLRSVTFSSALEHLFYFWHTVEIQDSMAFIRMNVVEENGIGGQNPYLGVHGRVSKTPIEYQRGQNYYKKCSTKRLF